MIYCRAFHPFGVNYMELAIDSVNKRIAQPNLGIKHRLAVVKGVPITSIVAVGII